ncbi:unnamed protein product [Pieris brassicae]|uniref:Uncharacterized protein n=1 Tax=Pieris brassicae TaxID=7116 RepID=A0A9P0T677_PIEBR|nr:unnamed protein product [Pieris brassicae]
MSDKDIDARSEILNTEIKSLRELQQSIEVHTVGQHDETAYEQEQKYRYDFEELYTTIITKPLTKKKLKQRQQEQQQRAQHHNEQQLHDQQQVRESIPKIQFQPLGASETFNNFKKRLEAYFRLKILPKIKQEQTLYYLHYKLCH